MGETATRFFIEPPQDEDGNTYLKLSVIEARLEPYNDGFRDRERVHIIAPAELVSWSGTPRDIYGWVETEGPARMLTRDEWERLTGFSGEGAGR
jgi:hypothetical protein